MYQNQSDNHEIKLVAIALSTVYSLMSKYHVDKVYIDGANPSFIRSLKLQIGEEADYDKVIANIDQKD
ncbi:MAG TPA: hypothetical protein VFJ51_13190 [Nitrososphaeraceae archaeon]|nr:hypothetical protein [Nitrososphaeraceae archaeon]